MRAVVQRVLKAVVTAGDEREVSISSGLIAYIGVSRNDTEEDCRYIADKIVNLRIFEDTTGKMNLSVIDVKGEILLVSQFTLYGDARKGRRPSYDSAADPLKGEELFNQLRDMIKKRTKEVKTGFFKAHMQVSCVNDGPVTIILDSSRLF